MGIIKEKCKGCAGCAYAPGNLEEYGIAQQNPSVYCPDAYSEKARHCGNFDRRKTEEDR